MFRCHNQRSQPLAVTGFFDLPTKKLLKQWLNNNWDIAGVKATKFNPTSSTVKKAVFASLHKLLLFVFSNARDEEVPEDCQEFSGMPSTQLTFLLHEFLNDVPDRAGLGRERLNTGTSQFEPLAPNFTRSEKSVKALQNFLNSVFSAK